LLTKRMRGESGYSLVEVLASILILSIAILPMVGMFDMGLNNATKGSNYDKSRALANLKLEEAKSISYANLESSFPVSPSTPNSASGYYDSGFIPAGADFTNFQYRIQKQYMKAPTASSTHFERCDETPNTCSLGTDLIRVTVTVRWADGNEYTTYGLVSA
jgi:prepilin-type N-terminal cleavage/methylation domain-containing protein